MKLRAALAAFALLLGSQTLACRPEPPPDSPDDGIPAEPGALPAPSVDAAGAEIEASPAADSGLAADGAPVIRFDPVGLSPLYQTFTGDEAIIQGLRARLAGSVSGGEAILRVTWDDRDKSGTITLHLPEKDSRWKPLASAVQDGQAVDLEPVSPVLAAVGAYRSDLGARFDLRFLAFRIRLSWWDSLSGSHCTLSGVANDPEGRQPARCFECVDFRAGALQLCRTEEAWPSPVEGPKRGLRMLSSAFQPTRH